MYLKYDLSIDDYVNIFKRKLFFIAGLASTLFIIAFFVILFLPSVYEATATILIESKTISAKEDNPWQPKKDNMTAKFEGLNTKLLANEKMLEIAKKYELFQPKNKKKVLTPQEEAIIAGLVRSQITTNLIKAETGSVYQEKQALAIQIGARFDTPETTYNIAQDIVNAFVNQTSIESKEKAVTASTFFNKEAQEKKKELERVEQELIAYKKSHAGMLPQNVNLQMSSLDRLEGDLRASQKEQSVARSELSSLEVELASVKAGVGLKKRVVNDARYNSYKDEVDKLRSDLSKAKTIYSDRHPAVKELKRKIAALTDLEEVKTNEADSVQEQKIEVARVQAQIDAVNRRIKAAEREERQIRSRMQRTESMVFASAQTEGVLDKLQRKYDAAKLAYADAKAKQDQAKITKDIELQDQGDRFVVTEPPIMPTYPVKPKRKLLLAASLILAAGLSFVIAVLMELFDRRLRGQDAISHTLKMQPMALIPYIKNKADAAKVRYQVMNFVYLNLTVITICLVVIHFFVSPFDEVMAKVTSKI